MNVFFVEQFDCDSLGRGLCQLCQLLGCIVSYSVVLWHGMRCVLTLVMRFVVIMLELELELVGVMRGGERGDRNAVQTKVADMVADSKLQYTI